MSLAFLAPGLQAQLLAGKQPYGLSLTAFLRNEMPLAWADQPAWLLAIART